MSFARSIRRPLLPLVASLAAGLVVTALIETPAPAQPPQAAEAEGLRVPPVPEGTPAELMAFVEGLIPPKTQPKSREEMIAYIRGVADASVQVADKILAQVQATDPIYERAVKLKLEALMGLTRFGDDTASTALATFASGLVDSPVAGVALEAKRVLVVAEAQQMFASEKFDAAPALVKKAAAILQANPDDQQSAMLAMQLCSALEQIPGGEAVAADALATFGPILATSKDERVRGMGESFAGKLRLLSLTGKPMDIKGPLLDGTAFDLKSLAGKVVLVDFWATWCGPCVAEIPNVVEQYEKYHAKGFEVIGISLDDDREKVDAFVAEHKIPWPIIFAGKGWEDPVAQFYGISGIPQMILIGRDGNVITLNARGERLGEQLVELFKDAG